MSDRATFGTESSRGSPWYSATEPSHPALCRRLLDFRVQNKDDKQYYSPRKLRISLIL